MNPLDLLKERLQIVLNESTESDCYQEALSDCIYACNLGVTALEEHISMWINTTWDDKEYIRGIAFVEEQWHKITGMF